jgi:hypothetical protein
MTNVFRFLVFSAFLLFLPAGATPPTKHPHPEYLCWRTLHSETALIRPYLLLLRFRKSEEIKMRVQICDVTVVMLVKGAAPAATQQGSHALNVLAIGSHKQCYSAQEVVHDGTSIRPASPML